MARREPKKPGSTGRGRGVAKALDAADARFERAREMLGAEPDATQIEHEQILAALKKAMRWLAQRDRSEADVRERLAKADFDTRVMDRAIDVLKKMGAINDQRHAAGVVERAMRDVPAGDALVEQALERQKVDKDTAAKAMSELASEKARVKDAAASVVARLAPGLKLDAKWRRAMGALLRRGFEEDAAREALETHLGAFDLAAGDATDTSWEAGDPTGSGEDAAGARPKGLAGRASPRKGLR